MTMRLRTILYISLMAMVVGISALSAAEITVNASRAIQSCSDVNFRIEGRAAVVAEERISVGGNLLAVRLGESQGFPLKVVGSDRSGYEVILCKGASDDSVLSQIRLQQTGETVTVAGPARSDWSGHVIVLAPRDGDLEIEATNGPVSISDLAGRLKATVANGPLSLKRVGGSVEVESRNGPVSFTGGSGDVSLTSKNGPLTINLEGSSWEGGELRTSAKNGPVTVRVPQGYASGLVLERGARTPLRCPAALCGERPEFFRDNQTRIEIGHAMPRVHVAAMNGPVTIKQAD
ncbi:MAG: hypothetical protein ABR524_05300 [Thermoanaerobaculia bacterium]